jgi:hypothetical protein
VLAVEELASNGLRHGRPPVQVTITAAALGWLLEVRDAETARPPQLAVGRDAALGGMGLALVARLSRVHGWDLDGDRKVVWARIPYAALSDASPRRVHAATARARDLVGCLAATEARITATLQQIAADAVDRSDRARVSRAVADHAASQALWARRPAPAALLPAHSGVGAAC